MSSRQGICASNGILRCGQAGPRFGLAVGVTGFVRFAALTFRRIAFRPIDRIETWKFKGDRCPEVFSIL
jgi:hypothetical protein